MFTKSAVLTAYEDRYLLHGPQGSLVLIVARPVPFVQLEVHARRGTGEPSEHHCDVLALDPAVAGRPSPCWKEAVTLAYTQQVYRPLVEELDIWSTLEHDYYRLLEATR